MTKSDNNMINNDTDMINNFTRFNLMIEEKIEEFHRDTNSEEAAWAVLEAILHAMIMEGHVLVPVETPDAMIEAVDPEKVKEGDVITLEEEIHWKLIHLNYEDGTAAMPVFTSREKLYETGLSCSTFDMFMDEYFSQVLEMENVKGIVVNPGEKGFFLSKEIIQAMLNEKDRVKMVQHKPSDKARFAAPENVPEGFKEIMSEFFRNNFSGQIQRVWFTGLEDDGDKSWLFAIETDLEEPRPVFDRIHTFMTMMGVKTPLDYMRVPGQPWPGAELLYGGEELIKTPKN